MKVSELLNEHNWIKGERALNHAGIATTVNDVDACQWCLIGAIEKCYLSNGLDKFLAIVNSVYNYLNIGSVVNWNDDPKRTFADIHQVITALDI